MRNSFDVGKSGGLFQDKLNWISKHYPLSLECLLCEYVVQM